MARIMDSVVWEGPPSGLERLISPFCLVKALADVVIYVAQTDLPHGDSWMCPAQCQLGQPIAHNSKLSIQPISPLLFRVRFGCKPQRRIDENYGDATILQRHLQAGIRRGNPDIMAETII